MNYDFSNFHPGHNKQVITAPDGLHIVCLDCGISANLEAISAKISPKDACQITMPGMERAVIGKQSAGIDRGEAIK